MDDLIGAVFGKLTIVKEEKSIKYGTRIKRRFLCQCECGRTKTCRIDHLKAGRTTSCGCKTIELLKQNRTTHGLSNHRLFNVWKMMMTRCNNKNHHSYQNYGGRGIKVCDEWEDIETFIKDMYPSFQEGLTLDRIDNTKGYSKYNCRWSTVKEQNNNKRTNVIVEFEDKKYTITQLSEKLKTKYTTLNYRIKKNKLKGAR